MMPKIAQGDANKVWVVPSEFTKALEGLGSSMHEIAGIPKTSSGPRTRVDMGSMDPPTLAGSGALDSELSKANKAVEDAIAAAEHAANPGRGARVTAAAADVPPAEPPTADDAGDAGDDGTTGAAPTS
jgi:hypothetical protein